MRFERLSVEHKDFVRKIYEDNKEDRGKAQEILASYFEVTERTIRNWASRIGLVDEDSETYSADDVLIYDIETSRIKGDNWWTGKRYVPWTDMFEDPRIITVSWTWLGSDKVEHLVWEDKPTKPRNPNYPVYGYGCDKKLIEEFSKVYNRASLAIGVNSDNFDKRFLAQRCLVHRAPFNRFVKSLDIQKASKGQFRAPSYSMKYSAQAIGIEQKLENQGMSMWRDVQYHKDSEVRAQALQEMVDYNVGDIITTQEWYLELIPYIDHKIHFGTLNNKVNWSCPNCGGGDIEKVKTTSTKAGTIQHIMQCHTDGQIYKISSRSYINYMQFKFD